MILADHLSRLGTETAFAVSAEAVALAATGRKIYPFHLGDLNIVTPDNVIEAAYAAMKDGKTGYCPNYGIPPLREALAEDVGRSHNLPYTMENVAVQPGGKPTIGKFIMALMNPGDEVLYPNPGYPIYESQIEFHGGVAVPYSYREGDTNFELKLDELEASITPKTRLLIFNDLQNPMAAEASEEETDRLSKLAIKHNLYVLSDEAYFDMRYTGQSKSIASLPDMKDRTVILYTFSKKFAMTGWRLGASIGPKNVIDAIAKLNVNDESCTTHFVQHAGVEGLKGDQSGPLKILEILKERRDAGVELLNSIEGIRCFKPNTTFYLFFNCTDAIKKKGFDNSEDFRKDVLKETGVSFCARVHFGRPDPTETEHYLRLAYSGIDVDPLKEALGKFKEYAEA